MEEYHILLTKHADYVEVNAQMRQEVEDVKQNHCQRITKYKLMSGNENIVGAICKLYVVNN